MTILGLRRAHPELFYTQTCRDCGSRNTTTWYDEEPFANRPCTNSDIPLGLANLARLPRASDAFRLPWAVNLAAGLLEHPNHWTGASKLFCRDTDTNGDRVYLTVNARHEIEVHRYFELTRQFAWPV